MEQNLNFRILPQPDETSCGPACLHAVYSYFGEQITIEQIMQEITSLKEGGTLAVFLACHALKKGYSAVIYTYDLNLFDPTWFTEKHVDISEKLIAQMKEKEIPKLHKATKGYLEFLELGGKLRFEDLKASLVRKYLKRSVPILTGLSSTYLYHSSREFGVNSDDDDIRGVPAGHFVVLCGYDKEERTVTVADPFLQNPYSESHHYMINIDRVLCSILLGVLTYDANLLVIQPKHFHRGETLAGSNNS